MTLADDAKGQDEIAELRRALRTTQAQLIRSKSRSDDLRDALREAATSAILTLGPLAPVPAPAKDRRAARPEVALMHVTDWQGSKVSPSYNTQVMIDRVGLYRTKVDKITAIMRNDHPVREAVILFGGDMIEGLFNFPTQVFEIDQTLFGQWQTVSGLIAETVRWALARFEKVTVVAEPGNHGRIGSKRDAVPHGDNFDRMCYEHARQLLAAEKRLTWEDCPEDIQRVVVGNYRALLIHGDEIGRTGFASPSTIVQHVNRWRSGAYRVDGLPWDFRDVYMGHYHTHAEWPMANGEGSVFQTGSTESDNRYARDLLASSARPSQRLHFVDPEKGRVTYQLKVHLDD